MKKVFLLCVIVFSFLVQGSDFSSKIDFLSAKLKKFDLNQDVQKPFPGAEAKNNSGISAAYAVIGSGKKKVSPTKGDLVVGYFNSDEELTITENYTVYGNVYVVNNGILKVENCTLTVYGDIVLTNNASFVLNNATLNIVSKFAYSNNMAIYDNSTVNFLNAYVNSNGFNWGVGIAANGRWDIKDSTFLYGVTTALSGYASAVVENSNPLEWVVDENTSLYIKDGIGPFMLWPAFGDGSVADITFPDGDNVSYFEISDSAAGMSGITINLVLENCTSVNWGFMVKKGANLTIRDSDMKTMGIMADTGNLWDLTGLVNNQFYSDYTIPVSEFFLRFVNTSVEVVNVYLIGADSLKVEDSVVGEIGVIYGQECSVFRTLVDGTGGYFFTDGDTVTTFFLSSLSSHAVAGENSMLFFVASAVYNGDIVAEDNAVILLANTEYSKTPRAYQNAFIINAAIDVDDGSVNSLIPLKGSASLFRGESCPVEFVSYSVYFGKGAEPAEWTAIEENNGNQVEKGVLGFWNTANLEPGYYTLKLVYNLNVGDPIEITRTIFLGEERPDYNAFFIPHIVNSDYWESYLVLDNTGNFNVKAVVYTMEGGRIKETKNLELNPYRSVKVAVDGECGYVIGGDGLTVREFFVSKTEGGIAQFYLGKTTSDTVNFLLPLYASDILTWQGIAFQNTEGMDASFNMTAYSFDGNVVGTGSVTVNAYRKSVGLLESFFENLQKESTGRIKCYGDKKVAGIVISGKNNSSLLFTSALSTVSQDVFYIPHIANEWNSWQNYIVLDNLSEQTASAVLVCYSNGVEVLNKNYSVPPNGQLTVDLNEFKDLSPEIGIVRTSGNVAVRQAFLSRDGGTAEFLLDGKLSATLEFNLPFTESERLNWSGIAIANFSDSGITVTLNAYSEGTVVRSTEITLQPYSRIAGVLEDFFPNLEGAVIERVEAVSGSPLTGITISGFNGELLLFSNPVKK